MKTHFFALQADLGMFFDAGLIDLLGPTRFKEELTAYLLDQGWILEEYRIACASLQVPSRILFPDFGGV